MFVTYDLATAEEGGMLKLQKLNLEAKAKGYKVIGMTASSPLHCQSIKIRSYF
jgi:hypothetical protein